MKVTEKSYVQPLDGFDDLLKGIILDPIPASLQCFITRLGIPSSTYISVWRWLETKGAVGVLFEETPVRLYINVENDVQTRIGKITGAHLKGALNYYIKKYGHNASIPAGSSKKAKTTTARTLRRQLSQAHS